MKKDKECVTIEFKPYLVEKNESGVVDTLFFQDEHGTIIRIKNTTKADFSKGILVTMNEPKYRAVKGKNIGPSRIESIVSIATNTEINLTELRETRVNLEPIREQDENELTILFKMLYFKPSIDKFLNTEVTVVKYIDPLGNSIYLSDSDYENLFGNKYFYKYIALTISLDDIQKDFEQTKLRYPETTKANFSFKSIRFAKQLNNNKYDYSILDEIQAGQRAGDERYNTKNVLDLYRTIFEFREQEKRRKENEIDFNAPFVRTNESKNNS